MVGADTHPTTHQLLFHSLVPVPPLPIILAIALVLIPIAGACLLLVFGRSARPGLPRGVALGSTLIALVVAGVLAREYYTTVTLNPEAAAARANSPISPAIEFRRPWLAFSAQIEGFTQTVQIDMRLGLDGVSVALMVLTALLSVSCVLISWSAIRDREAEFYVALLMLQAGLFGVFCAFDLVLFYVFF